MSYLRALLVLGSLVRNTWCERCMLAERMQCAVGMAELRACEADAMVMAARRKKRDNILLLSRNNIRFDLW